MLGTKSSGLEMPMKGLWRERGDRLIVGVYGNLGKGERRLGISPWYRE